MRKLINLDVKNQYVLLRTEFNVTLDDNHAIVDDSRVRASLPTIEWLSDNGARVVICSHLGRPWGKQDPSKSLRYVLPALERQLERKVMFAGDCIGDKRMSAQQKLAPGDILLLENVRYYREENDNDLPFARALADGIDLYVNDAFGNCHRPHASMVALARVSPVRAPGFLLESELIAIQRSLETERHPLIAIVGGAKVAGKDGKINVIRNLLQKFDEIYVVGKIAYFFLCATGIGIGRTIGADKRQIDAPDSDVEAEVAACATLIQEAGTSCGRLVLPMDSIIMTEDGTEALIGHDVDMPAGAIAVDIGPKTRGAIEESILGAACVVWNGPAGYIEDPRFRMGTQTILDAIAAGLGDALVGGGDTVSALGSGGLSRPGVHVSTGGGAMLTLLMGQSLVAVEALKGEDGILA